MQYLNPVIANFLEANLNQEENKDEENKEETVISSIFSDQKLSGTNELQTEDVIPFLKPGVSKDLYDYFRSPESFIKKAKLETLKTILALYHLSVEDYYLRPEDVENIKNDLEQDRILSFQHHIQNYNEVALYKKELDKNTFTDSVYESKIEKEKVPYFSKTISDVYSQRKRAFSQINTDKEKIDFEKEYRLGLLKSQNKGELYYYPDGPKSSSDNFGINTFDDEREALRDEDISRYYESLNSNKNQGCIKYYIKEFQRDLNFGSQSKGMDACLWDPEMTLVNTLYNFNNYTNKILDLDVSQDSRYFTSISEKNIKMWNCQDVKKVEDIFDINCTKPLT
mmetsp:Transcript_38770/g.38314  ORF Transcript_38770/g.38314 Transcript_38770/m.38314 type:complete len:339 (-) Transcript_38770:1082-2098(-)